MKRCQVCGQVYDPEAQENCPVAFRGQHIPTDRPGTVYVLCFGAPIRVAESDRRHVQPTTHYVGWTGQAVARRIRQHGADPGTLAYSTPGTAEDELKLKQSGDCPRCGVELAPECLGRRRNAAQ